MSAYGELNQPVFQELGNLDAAQRALYNRKNLRQHWNINHALERLFTAVLQREADIALAHIGDELMEAKLHQEHELTLDEAREVAYEHVAGEVVTTLNELRAEIT